jgi:hypothetical protein
MYLKNRATGEEKWFEIQSGEDRSAWLFGRRIKDFDRLMAGEKMCLTFLTVTQSNQTIGDGSKWVSSVMRAMQIFIKRRGEKIYYVAVLEIQPKRYKQYGVLAAHWHIAIASSKPDLFPHAKRSDEGHIIKVRNGKIITWAWLFENVKQKFGLYFVCDGWGKSVYDYLAKYLAKDELLREFKKKMQEQGKQRVKVFSSSRFPIEYQMNWIQQRDYKLLVADEPDIKNLYWRREGSPIVARAKRIQEGDVLENGYKLHDKIFYDKVLRVPGEWILLGSEE